MSPATVRSGNSSIPAEFPVPVLAGGDGPTGGPGSDADCEVAVGAAVPGALAVSADAGGVELGGMAAGALGPVLVSFPFASAFAEEAPFAPLWLG